MKKNVVPVNKERIEKIEDPEPGLVYLADPRQFKLSPLNVRKRNVERGLKGLATSILEAGFKIPAISNMKYEIVAGGRRWRIAMKYGIKFPVVFKEFPDEVSQIVESILENNLEPLDRRDLGEAIILLREKGLTVEAIANLLGISYKQLQNLVRETEIPEELPEDTKEAIEKLPPKKKRETLKLVKVGVLKPEEVAKIVSEEVPADQLKEMSKEVAEGEKIEVSKRLEVFRKPFVTKTLSIPKEEYLKWQKKAKRRAWDLQLVIRAFLNLWVQGKFDLSQEEYENAGMSEGSS